MTNNKTGYLLIVSIINIFTLDIFGILLPIGGITLVTASLLLTTLYITTKIVSTSSFYWRTNLLCIIIILLMSLFAINSHEYSIKSILLYTRSYYALPLYILACEKYKKFYTIKKYVLVYIIAVVVIHIMNGLQGNYISHHMVDGVSRFSGISGHFHHSYIAMCATILAINIYYKNKYKTIAKQIMGYLVSISLLSFPVIGAARGAIVTNLICVGLLIISEVKSKKVIKIANIYGIYTAIIISVIVYLNIQESINNEINRSSSVYSNVGQIMNVAQYQNTSNYLIRQDWWENAVKVTLAESPVYGTLFSNIGNEGYRSGSMPGSMLHSYFMGALQDGGILLLLMILLMIIIPLIQYQKTKRQLIIEEHLWLIAIIGCITSNTWMYGAISGTTLAIILSYTLTKIYHSRPNQYSNFILR